MIDCCDPPHPLARDGTSQPDRAVAALDPASAPLDDRQLDDVLVWVHAYARTLVHTDPTDQPATHWQSFFAGDPSVIIAGVMHAAPRRERRAFAEDLAAAPNDLSAILKGARHLLDLAVRLEQWRRRLPSGTLARRALDAALDGEVRSIVRQLKALTAFAALLDAQLDYDPLDRLLDPPVAPHPEAWSGAEPPDRNAHARRRVAGLFDRLVQTLERLVHAAPSWMKQTVEAWPRHAPHMTLLMAFLQVLDPVRGRLNSVVDRHLRFYYRDVLRLEPTPPGPDSAHLVAELARGRAHHALAADALFKAGEDISGRPLRYGPQTETVVTRGAIAEVRSLYLERAPAKFAAVPAPVARSGDGEGGAFPEGEAPTWPAFGHARRGSGERLQRADLGFVVATDLLWMAEGTRVVRLTLNLQQGLSLRRPNNQPIAGESVVGAVNARLSTAEGWFSLSDLEITPTLRLAGKKLLVEFTLPADAPPVIAPAPETDAALAHGGRRPLLEVRFLRAFLLRNQPALASARIDTIRVRCDVSGVETLVVETPQGAARPDKPFAPFGARPRIGATAHIGCWEALAKPLDSLSIEVTWAAIDPAAADYYGSDAALLRLRYGADSVTLPAGRTVWGLEDNRVHFIAELAAVKAARVVNAGARMKAPAKGKAKAGAAANAKETEDLAFPPTLAFDGAWRHDRLPNLAPFDRYEAASKPGFLSVELLADLRHDRYPIDLAQAIRSEDPYPPEPPVVPTIDAITLSYVASGTLSPDHDAFMHLLPFGRSSQLLGRKPPPIEPFLVRLIKDGTEASEPMEGGLYIGLTDFSPPATASMLIQVAEGSAHPEAEPPPVHWSYLAGDSWHPFDPAEVLTDATDGLLGSGLVRLAVPAAAAATDHTRMPAGIVWVRAAVTPAPEPGPDAVVAQPHCRRAGPAAEVYPPRAVDAVCRLVDIHGPALKVTLASDGNTPEHFAAPLPAGNIAKLVKRDAAFKGFEQPYASFGGRPAETTDRFRRRVSERLRHKGRAIATWDHEHLVLQAFPDIYKARCISHTDAHTELAPGSVTVVVVPDLKNQNAVDPLRPRVAVGRLRAIKRFLAARMSPHADVEVVNPQFEAVSTRFRVKLRSEDVGYHLDLLHEELTRFLSPWAFEDGIELEFGGRIHASAVVDFLDRRPYVDAVFDFELWQDALRVEEAAATSARSILVSANSHAIVEAEEPKP